MKIIANNWTESRISTFSGESAGDNADNIWFQMLNSCQNLFWIEDR